MQNQARSMTSTIEIDGCDTLAKLWRKACWERGSAIAHREKKLGIWQARSWQDWFEGARAIGLGLMELGLERGQVVSVLSEDRLEWLYADLGIVAAGGITNGIYTTDSARQLAFLVEDSESAFLLVENDEQLDKFLAEREAMPGLKKVIVFDRKGLRDFADPQVMFLDELMALGRAASDGERRFDVRIDAGSGDEIRMLIYTSGTTGAPKGAMISHRNVLFMLDRGDRVLDVQADDEQLCFLPLSHILERLISVEMPIYKGVRVNFAESPETVFDNLREISPHAFTAVPRLWEKLYSAISDQRREATAFGRWAFDRALKAGHDYQATNTPGPTLRLRHAFWDLLVLKNLRQLIGMDRIRRATTGAAPIAPDLIRWFQAIGVPLYEGYGMTETTGIISVNTPERSRIGSVGVPLPDSEVRIAEDGEILVRGQHVFEGYWKRPEQTARDMRAGWLHTGDSGRLDAGMLTITGRIKDIIITAGGKNIAPAEIESKLKFSPYIADAVLVGDQRKYLTCLIMIDRDNVETWAQRRQVPFSDFRSLCRAEAVQELIGEVVNEVNSQFAQVEQIKYFRLIDVMLSADDEELTATMKLKRAQVEKKYRELIESMY
ncbi:MAG: long-chain fatty acid--CoA ligase [Wenzhouxiangellaceae bacterium]|nr:MAG: long-chain fatty acid--CoA ligase [Wenzhouxiangellaceae bacterium]